MFLMTVDRLLLLPSLSLKVSKQQTFIVPYFMICLVIVLLQPQMQIEELLVGFSVWLTGKRLRSK